MTTPEIIGACSLGVAFFNLVMNFFIWVVKLGEFKGQFKEFKKTTEKHIGELRHRVFGVAAGD